VATFARVVPRNRACSGDGDRLELGAVAEDGDAAAALMAGGPAFLDCLGPVRFYVLLCGDDTGRDGGLAEQLGGVLLGPQP
jgi:hypothetical protein